MAPDWGDGSGIRLQLVLPGGWATGARAGCPTGQPGGGDADEGIKNTDDHTDARWLAEQVRLGVFPASSVYPRAIRGVRDALRRRQLFVRRRIQAVLSLEGLLVRYGVEAPGNHALQSSPYR